MDHIYTIKTNTTPEKLCGPNVNTIFRVKITQIEMLRDRGYNVSDDQHWLDIKLKPTAAQQYMTFCTKSAEEGNLTIRKVMTSSYSSIIGTRRILVYYPDTPDGGKTIGKCFITDVVEYMTRHRINHTIIISDTPLSHNAQQTFNTLPSFTMEHFLYRELKNNATKYFLVPKQTLLTPDQVKQLLQEWKDKNLNIEQFPKMSIQDPIVRYYGAQPGDIFKVNRFVIGYDAMVSYYLAYRIVTSVQFNNLTNLADKSTDKAI